MLQNYTEFVTICVKDPCYKTLQFITKRSYRASCLLFTRECTSGCLLAFRDSRHEQWGVINLVESKQ